MTERVLSRTIRAFLWGIWLLGIASVGRMVIDGIRLLVTWHKLNGG